MDQKLSIWTRNGFSKELEEFESRAIRNSIKYRKALDIFVHLEDLLYSGEFDSYELATLLNKARSDIRQLHSEALKSFPV